jgi:ATP-dependent Lhr-like helicase
LSSPSFEDALLTAVQGWIAHLGPTTASEIGELLGLPAPEIEKALLRIEASGAILRGRFRSAQSLPAGFEGEPETEWCERRLLARIHRLTVATLRKQIAPVTASQFMNWLLRWQHLAPGTQVRGEHGTLEVIRQLQGFEIPASAWERFVLARRISDYDPAHLDQLCLAGVVGWGRLSPHPATLEVTGSNENGRDTRRRVIPTRVAPIAFFVREDADWLRPHHPGAEDSATSFLSPVAQSLLELLKHRGALFFPDMVRATGRLKAEIETGLWELVAAGLVTADGFENLRALVTPKGLSSGGVGKGIGKVRRPRHAPGRWSLLHTEGADRDRSVESCCWMLLRRYGVVFRDLLTRETNLPRWRELQIGYRRLEDRGEVRGGRFVDGFVGEQFALPVAVESLRAHRKLPQNAPGERVIIAAADPLNLVGIIVPGERIPAISGRSVTFRDGVWEADDVLLASGVSTATA